MKVMRLLTHKEDIRIPEDMAMLYMDNSGWVGTNNGWPHSGQPAMFPLAQAEAIATAWNYVLFFHPSLSEMPGRNNLSEATQEWFDIPKVAVE